jgi:iron complex outermembrane receptor protein
MKRYYFLIWLFAVAGATAPALAAESKVAGVTGTVKDARGRPIEHVDVLLTGSEWHTFSGQDGKYAMDGIAPGHYVLRAQRVGYRTVEQAVDLAAGTVLHVDLQLATETIVMHPVVVGSAYPKSYRTDVTTGGARMPVPMLDLPQDVNVVNNDLIDDRGMNQIGDLASSVSGVVALPGYTGSGLGEQEYVFRGIPSSYTLNALRDGFKDFAGVGPRDVSSIDRVEFLKGPSSFLYGATGALGGVANTITKSPLATNLAELEAEVDGYGKARGTLDLGGHLAADGAWRYRCNAAGERISTFRDYTDAGYGVSVAPVVEWMADSTRSVLVRGEYTRRVFRDDPYLPLTRDAFDLPIEQYYGVPDGPLNAGDGYVAQVEYRQRLGGGVRLRAAASAIAGDLSHTSTSLLGVDDSGMVLRASSVTDEGSRDYAFQSDVVAEFSTGSVRHRLLGGLDVAHEKYFVDFTEDSLASISMENPQYGAKPVSLGNRTTASHPQDEIGVFAQDFIGIGKRLTLLAGARFDATRVKQYVDDVAYGKDKTSHVSPRFGAIYRVERTTSVYGTYSQSFWPNEAFPEFGDPPSFPPETGDQFEAGIKREFCDGRLGMTVAGYQLTKNNVLEANPDDPYGGSILTGQRRSRGIEVDAQGEITRSIRVSVAYAYTDARISETVDPIIPAGQRLSLVAFNRGSVWGSYRVNQGSLVGVELGAGVDFSSNYEASLPNDVLLPGYARIDAMLGYGRGPWDVQVNAINITDERSYSSATAFNYALVPMEPAAVQLSLRWGL